MERLPVLYVVGPVSGYHNDNRQNFEAVREKLQKSGYKVIIPHDGIKPGTPAHIALRVSLVNMLSKAHGVAVLDGRWSSHIASIEIATARDCEMPIKKVSEWIHYARPRD